MGLRWWESAKDVREKELEEVAARDRRGVRSIRRTAWRGRITQREATEGSVALSFVKYTRK